MPYSIGPTSVSMVTFREPGVLIHVPPPKGSLKEATESRPLASGKARWLGYPVVSWHWDFFRPEWYDILRSICPGSSGEIYIRTTTNDYLDEFQVFRCIYEWPLELEKDSHRRMDFNVTFRRCIELISSVTVDTAIITVVGQPITVVVGPIIVPIETAFIDVFGYQVTIRGTQSIEVSDATEVSEGGTGSIALAVHASDTVLMYDAAAGALP